jgi:hypothetical protein
VSKEHEDRTEDRTGLLVVRAFIEHGKGPRLLVKLLEVNPAGPDQIVGIVDSSAAASRLVHDWLNSLKIHIPAAGNVPHPPVEGER